MLTSIAQVHFAPDDDTREPSTNIWSWWRENWSPKKRRVAFSVKLDACCCFYRLFHYTRHSECLLFLFSYFSAYTAFCIHSARAENNISRRTHEKNEVKLRRCDWGKKKSEALTEVEKQLRKIICATTVASISLIKLEMHSRPEFFVLRGAMLRLAGCGVSCVCKMSFYWAVCEARRGCCFHSPLRPFSFHSLLDFFYVAYEELLYCLTVLKFY